MLSKLSILLFACFITLNSCGCVSIPGSDTKTQKELKLRWNVSYLRGLVLVQGALKTEPIQFEKASIGKESIQLKGKYTDGNIIQIIILKINSSESTVAVNIGASQAAKDQAKKILEQIAQYSKGGR